MNMRMVLAFTVLFTGCQATYFFNLMEEFKIGSSTPPSDTSTVDGPPGVGGKAIVYGPNAEPVQATGASSAFLIYALTHSDDFTYYTWFRMPRKPINDEKWIFFALQDKRNALPVFFSVGLLATSTGCGSVEGSDECPVGKVGQYLFVQQYTDYDRLSKASKFFMKEDFEANKWYKLMIRMKTVGRPKVVAGRKRRAVGDVIVQVRVDCKDVGSFKIQEGPFEKYLPNGYMVFGSLLKKSNTAASGLEAEERFPGAMAESQIINGEHSFNYYSPCDADFGKQKIPSEPLVSEYSNEKKLLFEKVLANVKTVILTCPQKVPGDALRYNGEEWAVGCLIYECSNGVIKEKWDCKTCTDKKGNLHRKGSNWTDTEDKCFQNFCEYKQYVIRRKDLRPCQTLNCADGFPPIQLASECCPKCASDTCDKGKGKTYYEGCQRTCDDGSEFVCKEKKKGCWCPAGQVEDEQGKCIKLSKCLCKAGKIIYKPGQTAIRSVCSTCVCINADMTCFDRC